MKAIIEYRRVKSDTNGNLRASAEIFIPNRELSRDAAGEPCDRYISYGSIAAIQGFKDDVWDVVSRMQASGDCVVIDRHQMHERRPRLGCATVSPFDLEKGHYEGVFPARLDPETVVDQIRALHLAKI